MAALFLATTACNDSTGPELSAAVSSNPDTPLVTAPLKITLRHGQDGMVGGTVLRVSFLRVVEDSRCPIDAICFWMGDGVAEVGIAAGAGPTFPLQLHTSMEPYSAEWNDVRLTLLELSPAPRASEPTRSADYVVTLLIEPRQRPGP